MPELPAGTVPFLFSDIESSTRLLQAQGDAWPGLLAEHRRLLREAFVANGGTEIGTEGDSFFVAFPSAASAVQAAVRGQLALAGHDWPTDARVRVRMGLHTTDAASIADGTYVGLDVHRAARIMAAAHGGQVLISASTRVLVQGALPDGVSVRDLGAVRLKDLPAPEGLAQLVVGGLQADFPPPRSLDATPHNLPPEATSFVGRELEVGEVSVLVSRNRLVTLTGPGGSGKTRLSVRVAAGLSTEFPDGVSFVALAPVREVELVLPTIAKSLGLTEAGPRPIEAIAERLLDRKVLLVLDNLEQVVEAAPDLGELLARAPSLSLLATSRGALHVYGEQEYPVPPLPMPDPSTIHADADITRFPAVALFVERARSVKPDFAVTDANAQAVAEICWRLDGLPLAIELAAARIRILTPQDMVGRLGRLLDMGAGGARDLPERQRTLRGAIAWSYDILDDEDRGFFASFSAFAGSVELDSVDAVLGGDARDAFGAVGSLLDNSLLRRDDLEDGTTRYRMLETIREYALERLAERADADELRSAHASHFLARAEAAASRIFSPEQKAALDGVERDHDNIRAALSWAIESGDAVAALRLVAACWRFWQMRGYLGEGAERVRRVLGIPGVENHPIELAAALEGAGGIGYWQGDMEGARDHYRRALALQRDAGDEAAVANALYNLTMTFAVATDTVPMTRQPEAESTAQEALAIYRRLGDRGGEGRVLWALLDNRILERRTDEVPELASQCLRIFTELGDRFMLAWTEYMLGLNETLDRDVAKARRHYTHALESFRESGDLSGFSLVFDGFAGLAFQEGDRLRAMRLAGAADALQRRGGATLGVLNRTWAGFYPDRLLSDPELAAAYAEGRTLELDAVIDLALTKGP